MLRDHNVIYINSFSLFIEQAVLKHKGIVGDLKINRQRCLDRMQYVHTDYSLKFDPKKIQR